jgi:ABC-type Fe3+-hydroxamate transport system substrate-binding protein
VGRHGYDLVLDNSLPVCGDQAGLDYEAISKLGPTHVFTQYDSGDVPPRLLTLGKSRGFAVTNFQLLTLEAVRTNAQELAKQFAVDGGRIDAKFVHAWSKRGAGFGKVGKVLLLGATDPPGVLGPGSFHYQILDRIGGTPAVTNGMPFITMDAEDILKIKPDAIVLVLPRGRGVKAPPPPSFEELVAMLGPIAKLDLPAIRSQRVALIDDPLAHTPSTAMIQLADEMRTILNSWSAASGR